MYRRHTDFLVIIFSTASFLYFLSSICQMSCFAKASFERYEFDYDEALHMELWMGESPKGRTYATTYRVLHLKTSQLTDCVTLGCGRRSRNRIFHHASLRRNSAVGFVLSLCALVSFIEFLFYFP